MAGLRPRDAHRRSCWAAPRRIAHKCRRRLQRGTNQRQLWSRPIRRL